MELYQPILEHLDALIQAHPERREFPYSENKCWKETQRFELVMARDTAYELGGSGKGAANFTCVTTETKQELSSRTIVIGKDLNELKEDTPYARIVMLNADTKMFEGMEEKQGSERAFRTLQKLDFIKYHVFAQGYMIRTSGENYREQVRLHKDAIREGITFEQIGNTFLKHYLEVDGIRSATILFATDPSLDYEAFAQDAKKVHEITMTLSKILEGMPTDCSLCSLKPICDEVEGMKELHFGKERTMR